MYSKFRMVSEIFLDSIVGEKILLLYDAVLSEYNDIEASAIRALMMDIILVQFLAIPKKCADARVLSVADACDWRDIALQSRSSSLSLLFFSFFFEENGYVVHEECYKLYF